MYRQMDASETITKPGAGLVGYLSPGTLLASESFRSHLFRSPKIIYYEILLCLFLFL